MDAPNTDVVVIGGSLAGCTTACSLAAWVQATRWARSAPTRALPEVAGVRHA